MSGQMTLRAIFELSDRFSANVQKIAASTNGVEKSLEGATAGTEALEAGLGGIGQGAGGIGLLNNSLLKTISLLELAKRSIDLFVDGVKTAANMEVQRNTLSALLGSRGAGDALFEYGEAYAKQSALDQQTVTKGLMTMANYTRDMDDMERGLGMIERLYAKDPNQGVDGAMMALKELMEGDTMSARNRYGMIGISGDELRKASDFGDRLDIIDEAMNRIGATEAVVQANTGGLLTQWDMFTSNLAADWGKAMDGVKEELTGFVQNLNQVQQSGGFQSAMMALADGAMLLAQGIAWVGENLQWIIPVLEGAAVAFIAYKVAATLAGMATLFFGAKAAFALGPILLIIFAVGVLVALLVALTGAANNAANSMAALDTSSLESLKLGAGEELKKVMDVQVKNPEPISVKGEVKIEDQSLKYLFDLAEERRARQYGGVSIQMQNTFGDIRETADVDALLDEILYRTETELAGMPALA